MVRISCRNVVVVFVWVCDVVMKGLVEEGEEEEEEEEKLYRDEIHLFPISFLVAAAASFSISYKYFTPFWPFLSLFS